MAQDETALGQQSTSPAEDPVNKTRVPWEGDEEAIYLGAVPLELGLVASHQVNEPGDGFVHLVLRPFNAMTGAQAKAFAAALLAAIDDQDRLSLAIMVKFAPVTSSALGSKLRVFTHNMKPELREEMLSRLNRAGFGKAAQPYDASKDPALAAYRAEQAAEAKKAARAKARKAKATQKAAPAKKAASKRAAAAPRRRR